MPSRSIAYRGDRRRNPAPICNTEALAQAKDVEPNVEICYILPMKRDEAIRRLQQHEADLKRLGVEHLYMFGSTARGEAGEDSDVDLFFDYEKGKLGLFELMDVKEYA